MNGTRRRRGPLAAALREVTVWLAETRLWWNVYVGTLPVQVALLAVLLYVAARSIAERHGIWAGLAFTGAIFTLGRQYLATTMTEPLGLAWALLAIVFFVEAGRAHTCPPDKDGQSFNASIFGAVGRFRLDPAVGWPSEASLIGLCSSYVRNCCQYTARSVIRSLRRSNRWKLCLHSTRTVQWRKLGYLLQQIRDPTIFFD